MRQHPGQRASVASARAFLTLADAGTGRKATVGGRVDWGSRIGFEHIPAALSASRKAYNRRTCRVKTMSDKLQFRTSCSLYKE